MPIQPLPTRDSIKITLTGGGFGKRAEENDMAEAAGEAAPRTPRDAVLMSVYRGGDPSVRLGNQLNFLPLCEESGSA